jgi:hypothetical protein
MHAEAAPMFVASLGSHKVVGPNSEEKRTMIKKVSLLVIVMGLLLASPLALGDKPLCPDDPDFEWPKCESTGGDSTTRYYNVEIEGFISGVGNIWGSGNKQVGFNFSDSAGPNGQLSSLGDFRDLFGTYGILCFPDDPINISSVILEKHKRGTARALIWFWAYTRDDNVTLHQYHLELNGLFTGATGANDWPPLESNTLEMTEWSTHLGNEGNTIRNVSCLSSGDTEDDTDFNGIDIIVTLD